MDNALAKGHWVVLEDANRFSATTLFGAAVQLELRANRIETSVVYNPRASAYLNGLGLTNGIPETADDLFYYAVEDIRLPWPTVLLCPPG